MINGQTTCHPDRIELYLQQKLSGEEQSAFESHLTDCDDCCRRLEASAASQDVWRQVRDSLGVQPADPFSPLPPGEGDFALDSTAGEDAFSSQATILKLLAPTDDDRSLGRWGIYEVVGVVGAGGMGVVLKALDAALNRYVAIKILAPHLGSSGAARKRFSREAQASAAVVHDNVIEIYGVSEAAGLPYLVMPYVRGPSLQRRLDDEGPLAVVELLRVGMQAAAGLAAAHAQGLVHRDVKPANILLADGIERVKLTDFGLARAADDASLTRTGIIAGTPQYMSPEQARGEPVDQRSDLFSLGSVHYAMCTGRPPFRAETSYGVLRRITDDEPRPIREINPNIPEWLCGIVEKLMAKRPDDRFQTAREVSALLEQCLAHVQQPTAVPLPEVLITLRRDEKEEPIQSDPSESITAERDEYKRGWSGRKRIVAAAIALLFFGGLVLAGILIHLKKDNKTTTIEVPDESKVHVDPDGSLTVELPNSPASAAQSSERNLPALCFDGRPGSYVSIPNMDMNRLTFATWVKRHVTRKKQYLIMPQSLHGWGVFFSEREGALGSREPDNDYLWFTAAGTQGWHSDAAVTDTRWHFVAVTLEDNVLRFYLDGEPAGKASMPYTLKSSSNYGLGGVADDAIDALRGSLAETLIFNRALDADEIVDFYRRGRGLGPFRDRLDGLVAGYDYDEGSGTTANDFSGLGRDGTLHGGVAWAGIAGQVIPPSLPPGSRYQLLLITGGSIRATSSDINVYNDFAAAQITNPALTSLGVSWKALVSTPSVSARKNAPTSTLPIYNTRGQLIALNSSDLWDSTISAFILDQYGRSDPRLAWTGTSPSGETYFGPWSLGGGGGYGGVGPHVAVVGGGGGDGGRCKLDWNWVAQGLLPWTDRHPVFALSTPITVLTREKEKAQGTVPPHSGALQFDGHHYAKVDHPPKFTSSDFTISLWFNPVRVNDWIYLFARGFAWHDQQGDIVLKFHRDSGNLDFQARTDDDQWLFGWDFPESRLKSAVHYGQWNHAVVTRRGDTYCLWVNGARVASEKSSADISDADNTNPFVVGGMMGDGDLSNANWYQGALDDLRIFRRCLSDKEIGTLYDRGGDPAALGGEGRVKIGRLRTAPSAEKTSAEKDGDRRFYIKIYPVGDLVAPRPAVLNMSEVAVMPQWPRNPWESTAQREFQQLMDLIRQKIASETWQHKGGKGTIDYSASNFCLVINQTKKVHQKIVDFLEDLRRRMDVQVCLQVRYLMADADICKRLGVNVDSVSLTADRARDFQEGVHKNSETHEADWPNATLFPDQAARYPVPDCGAFQVRPDVSADRAGVRMTFTLKPDGKADEQVQEMSIKDGDSVVINLSRLMGHATAKKTTPEGSHLLLMLTPRIEIAKEEKSKTDTPATDAAGSVTLGPAIGPPAAAPSHRFGGISTAKAPLRRFDPGFPVSAIALSPDGRLIAAADDRSNMKPAVKVLDAATGSTVAALKLAAKEEEALFADPGSATAFHVSALAFSPNGKVLAVGTISGQVKLCNPHSGELLRVLDDEKAKLADKRHFEKLESIKRAMGSVESLAFSPNGKTLATSGPSFHDSSNDAEFGRGSVRRDPGPGRLKLWDLKTGTIKEDLAGNLFPSGLAFSKDGRWLADAGGWFESRDNWGIGAVLWSLEASKPARRFIKSAPGGPLGGVAFSPDGKLLAIGTGENYYDKVSGPSMRGRVDLFHTATGIMAWSVTVPSVPKLLAISRDGKTVAVLCAPQSIQFLDAGIGLFKSEIRPAGSTYDFTARWNDFAIAGTGDIMAVGGVDRKGKGCVEVWSYDAAARPGGP